MGLFSNILNFPAGGRSQVSHRGGVRGIVELVMLAEIEKAVGFGIRIQDLFDLVIGTSTGEFLLMIILRPLGNYNNHLIGGLVALGVFEKEWSLSEAIDRFCSLAKGAFSLQKVLAVPGLSLLVEPFRVFKHKRSGINEALKTAVGDDYLFGQVKGSKRWGDQAKVGVVTCHDGRNHPCLLANYSRNPIDKLKDGREACKNARRCARSEHKLRYVQMSGCNGLMSRVTTFRPGRRECRPPSSL